MAGSPTTGEKQDVIIEAHCRAPHFVKGSEGPLHKWVLSKLNPQEEEVVSKSKVLGERVRGKYN